MLLREFDERTGWGNGFASCAHWLHWRTGIALGAAREKVRVAHALATLPRVSATMQRGAISFAKVRALTRIATPENEAALLDFAQAGTAAHVERLAGAWRRVDQVAAAKAEARHLHRHLSTWVDDDGMVVIRGRLTPEVGAVVQRALEAATDRLFRDAKEVPKAESLAEEVTPAQRRADALGLLAEAALTSDLDRGSAGDRYQVVLHVDAPIGVAAGEGLGVAAGEVLAVAGEVCRGRSRSITARSTFPRRRRDASPATRPSCGWRTPPTAQSSTSGARRGPCRPRSAARCRPATTRCRFPGCTARRCDAHHVEHWIDGGVTSLDNLVLLCRRHHRAVHEGGFGLTQNRDGPALRPPQWHHAGGGPAAAGCVTRLDLVSRRRRTSRFGTARHSTPPMPSMCSTRPQSGVRPDLAPVTIGAPGGAPMSTPPSRLEEQLRRTFGDDDPTTFGTGWMAGTASVFLGTLAVLGALAFSYPALLTTAEFRTRYPVPVLRALLEAVIGVAFLLGATSMMLRRRKVLGLVGIALAGAATLAGGGEVALGDGPAPC